MNRTTKLTALPGARNQPKHTNSMPNETTLETPAAPAVDRAAPCSALFSLAQVLSITSSRLCCDIGGVYDILNHATGDNLFTHVLPRARKFAAPRILALYPQLEAAGTPKNLARLSELIDNTKARNESPMAGVNMWLDWMREPGTCNLAASYTIPSWADSWLSFDPIKEAESMMRPGQVVVVQNAPAMPTASTEIRKH